MSRAMRKKIVWLPYDFDTAIATNNEGALVFSYNLEDIDHLPSGADIFNGQQSVLWKNLREMFQPELKRMYQDLRSRGILSYAVVEKMFEDHQAKWPENIFNEDAYYKYLSPLVDDGDASYLSMLQGSKAEQRKWWLYNRFRYIDSKYNAGDALTDVITVRGYAKANITVTPYADVYAAVKYGSYLVQSRATRNVATTLVCPLDSVNDTEIYIYSASQLASVGDLSGLMVGYADFSMATKLQNLVLGRSNEGLETDDPRWYSNGNLQNLYLGNNTLLQSINVMNCVGLGLGDQTTVDISGCSNIRTVLFEGTNVSAVTLPEGGVLQTLHLPGTITALKIVGQKRISEFICPDFSHITTLWLDNVSDEVNALDIIFDMASGSRIRLFNFSWEMDTARELTDFIAVLNSMRGIDQSGNNTPTAQVYGSIYVPILSNYVISYVHERYPDITLTYDVLHPTVYYYDDDGETLIDYEIVEVGQNAHASLTPVKQPTNYYTYAFQGWAGSVGGEIDPTLLENIQGDTSVYAVYSASVRYFTVLFYQDSTLVSQIGTASVIYGASAEIYVDTDGHARSAPEYVGPGDAEDYIFLGWSQDVSHVTEDMQVYAIFRYQPSNARKYLQGTMTNYTDDNHLTSLGPFAFAGMTNLVYLEMDSLEFNGVDIPEYMFAFMRSLATVYLPEDWTSKATKVGEAAFYLTTFPALEEGTEHYFDAATEIESWAFCNCTFFEHMEFPHVAAVGTRGINSCSRLTYLSIGLVTNYISTYMTSGTPMETLLLPAITNSPLSLSPSSFGNTTYNDTLKVLDVGYIVSFGATLRNFRVLETLVMRNTNLISFSSSSVYSSGFFYANGPIAQGTGFIYVPQSLINSYQSAAGWSTYRDQFVPIEGSEWELQ